MGLRELAQEIGELDPEKNARGYLEHYIRQNWKAGSKQLSIGKLSNNNFDAKFVSALFKKENARPSSKESEMPVLTDDDILDFSDSLHNGIFPGQNSLTRTFYYPDKKGQESAPTFTLEILRNISKATQSMVETALQEDFTVSLELEAQHYNQIVDNSEERYGAPPQYVGDTYEATGNIFIAP